jgi:D-alanyl-D-alanine carboxypeptidase/D-alanyl-D-alanine-endopeptidase (penicillin-binding protein 4)
MKRRTFLLALFLLCISRATAQAAPTSPLVARINAVLSRPALAHSTIGIEFFDLATKRPIYALNAHRLFNPASTTKVVTVGGALQTLGPDYQYHTRVFRNGNIDANGTLHGDLILVASGDPNLSGRQRPGGTLAFNDEDHSYGGDPVSVDPLAALRDIAQQIETHGITAVDGRVLVDISLFPEGDVESGTGLVVSPACLNDNIVDVQLAPGQAPGFPVSVLAVLPPTPYVTFVNHATTGPKGSDNTITLGADTANPDGSRTVDITGSMPFGRKASWLQYGAPSPSAYLRFALTSVLSANHISVQAPATPHPAADFAVLSKGYTDANLVADHASVPLAQDARITLKMSQNLHAQMMPYLLGALVAHSHDDSNRAGLRIERAWLKQAGLDISEAAQADGEGTAAFTPDFMTHYLSYVAHRPWFPAFFNGLPVLGRDGTLVDIQRSSPAAGHVVGKTGTDEQLDFLDNRVVVIAKGLVGYFTTSSGRRVAFAVYINNVLVRNAADVDRVAGQTVGELAAIGYESIR